MDGIALTCGMVGSEIPNMDNAFETGLASKLKTIGGVGVSVISKTVFI